MSDHNKKTSIAAVVLTVHRKQQLKIVIDSLRNQTRKPDQIIVVFQGKSEAIEDWLTRQDDINLHVQENLGSAGGFATGMQLAINEGHDWVWVTDDDAFPEPNALEELTTCKYFNAPDTGMLTTAIIDAEGKTYMSPVPDDDHNQWYGSVLEEKCLPIKSAAWPGCLISTAAIKELGLPISDYFFYDEDIEFTTRIARRKPCYCVISAIVNHHQSPAASLWLSKERYSRFVRNRFATIRLSDDPVLKKIAKQYLWLLKIGGGIVVGKIPVGALAPLIKGWLFFRPKITYPE